MDVKRHRVTLLFNANKAYDRQVIEGVGEYLNASQAGWDIFIEEDFRTGARDVYDSLGDGVIADFDDPDIEDRLRTVATPVVAVGGSYLLSPYPPTHYIATDNFAQVTMAFNHLKEKGLTKFAFYGLPPSPTNRWAAEREMAFRELVAQDHYRQFIYQGLETSPGNWQHAQNRLADWLQQLPAHTGIIAVTDARARHLLLACENLLIPVPEKLCVIGIDNEELTRFLSRVSLSSVVQGTRQMGYQAAKLLNRLLNKEDLPLQHMLIPPQQIIERRSTDYRSLHHPHVIQAMHFIRSHACKGIRVEQVLDAVGISRTGLEKRFREETGSTIHAMIKTEKLSRSRELLSSTSLPISEIAQICGYQTLQYFYSVFGKESGMTPKAYRQEHLKVNY